MMPAHLLVAVVRPEAQVVHGDQDAPLRRLQPVAHVRQRPADDDAHGVGQIAVAEFVLDVEQRRRRAARGTVLTRYVGRNRRYIQQVYYLPAKLAPFIWIIAMLFYGLPAFSQTLTNAIVELWSAVRVPSLETRCNSLPNLFRRTPHVRRILFGSLQFVCRICLIVDSGFRQPGGRPPADTIAAKITREKKLKAKISVDSSEGSGMMLREILDEIKSSARHEGRRRESRGRSASTRPEGRHYADDANQFKADE